MPIGVATRSSLLRALAVCAVGFVLGASGATLQLGKTVDRLTLDNAVLMDEVERLAGELASREKTLTERTSAPVRSVEVQVENVAQEHVRLHIQQYAHDLLKHLVGEDVGDLNPTLIERALERTIDVDKESYTVAPTLMILGSRIVIRLEARLGKTDITY